MGKERQGYIYDESLLFSLLNSLVILLLVAMSVAGQSKPLVWLSLFSSAGVIEKISLELNCTGALL